MLLEETDKMLGIFEAQSFAYHSDGKGVVIRMPMPCILQKALYLNFGFEKHCSFGFNSLNYCNLSLFNTTLTLHIDYTRNISGFVNI